MLLPLSCSRHRTGTARAAELTFITSRSMPPPGSTEDFDGASWTHCAATAISGLAMTVGALKYGVSPPRGRLTVRQVILQLMNGQCYSSYKVNATTALHLRRWGQLPAYRHPAQVGRIYRTLAPMWAHPSVQMQAGGAHQPPLQSAWLFLRSTGSRVLCTWLSLSLVRLKLCTWRTARNVRCTEREDQALYAPSIRYRWP
ncbi:uncharacterized protein B0I36DRAFT_133157 [Microdochium trichocladiopsis]|uniref:Uncharacterized protein n=1 Tax=Microdochium trichocladiopsis TaxID=1682393 RepID=A0A9P8Y4B6_9PEZI|nr:uncharacterized protein B0I36DRAFT_133157 [Microdochium trichocladiopsis]KAH7029478.1 hypothetical protein B0I36DRAFT_133157 [Microdochium trichocladiopsis]